MTMNGNTKVIAVDKAVAQGYGFSLSFVLQQSQSSRDRSILRKKFNKGREYLSSDGV